MPSLVVNPLKSYVHVPALACLLFASLLAWPGRVSAIEDPPGCSLPNGGAGNTSQGGVNFNLPFAHVGDTVALFPSLGMSSNACRAINATGSVYIASGLLTNFLVDVILDPGRLVSCPADALCNPGPYSFVITPGLVGAPVNTPAGSALGVPKRVRAVENGLGTVLAGEVNEQLASYHSATIQIVTPCIQVFKTCDLPQGAICFPAGSPVRFRGSVTNCGDIALTNVTVIDSRSGVLQLFNPTNGLPLTNNVTLSPGAYAVFSNSFLPALQDTCAGSASSVVTATGTDTTAIGGPRASVTNSYSEACAICVEPAIVVSKSCPPGARAPGAVLNFTGTVTNTGNITLTNVTIVNDRLLADGSTLVASFPALTSGEFRSFSGSYIVPINLCSVTDTLTARGTTPCGASVTNTASATCAVTNTPRLALTQNCPAVPPAPGQPLVFTGTVTNIGDVAVTNIVIVKNQPTNNSPVTVVTRLEPGQGTSYSGSFLVPATACGSTDTLTATGFDVCGTIVTASVTRICAVADVQRPTINCPANITVNAAPGRCTSNVNFTVSAADNCALANLVSTPTNGFAFPIGTTTVTSVATDASGNSTNCSFTVTVLDNQRPTITCPANVTVNAAAARCTSNVNFMVSAADNCAVTNLVSTPTNGFAFPIGTTTVTSVATDASGNSTNCSFTVTVLDNQRPTITCPANLTANAAPGSCTSNVNFTLSAADNCAVTNLVSTPTNGFAFPIGTTTVTSVATDASGNSTNCSFTVTVLDNQRPTITCPANLTINAAPGSCASNVSFTVSAADNCAVTNLVSNPTNGFAFPIGTTTVTSAATDASGNTTNCSFTVTVIDDQPPVIKCPTNLVVTADPGQCSRGNLTFVVSATDNCSVTNLVSDLPSGSAFPIGVTTVTSTATDASGNTSSCTFTVTVKDEENPVFIRCPTNETVEAGTAWAFGDPAAGDNCGEPVIVVLSTSTNLGCGSTLTATRTWRATDGSGNTNDCSQTVTVVDTTPPFVSIISPLDGSLYGTPATITVLAGAISLAGPITKLEFWNGTNLVSEVTNAQNVAGVYTNSIVLTNVPVGTYLFTVRATDPCGLTNTSIPVTVSVVPAVPPDFEVGPVFLNPLNGLWQQLIRMTNTGIATIVSVQALFTNIQPAGAVIYNANGITNNEPYIFYGQPIQPGDTAVMLVQYYTTEQKTPSSTVRFVVLVAPPSPPDLSAAIPVPITKAQFLARSIVDGFFLIDFNTKTNAQYHIQYTADLNGGTNTVWTTSLLLVNGNGGPLRWLDYGPAATESLPKGQPRRFYRVLELPR